MLLKVYEEFVFLYFDNDDSDIVYFYLKLFIFRQIS